MTKVILGLSCLLLQLIPVASFVVAPPQQQRNRDGGGTTALDAVVESGDTVLVIGGTGGVGQLVTKKLRNRGDLSVRVTARDPESARETIGDDQVEVFPIDLLSEDTAALESALTDASAVVISVGTTAFPTMRWKGGNTPEAVDRVAVTRIADIASKISSMKRIVLITSVGVDRINEMPFVILNLFGVLDAKRGGEQAVKKAAEEAGINYVIIRPGRLVGGPYTNLDLAKLLEIEGGAENGVTMAKGDDLLGDCKRDACAEAVVKCLTTESSGNLDFSIISNEDKALTDEQWASTFAAMHS